jgi:hypothetical protein
LSVEKLLKNRPGQTLKNLKTIKCASSPLFGNFPILVNFEFYYKKNRREIFGTLWFGVEVLKVFQN